MTEKTRLSDPGPHFLDAPSCFNRAPPDVPIAVIGDIACMIERHEKKQAPRILKPELATDPENALHPGTHSCECCGNEYDKPIEIVRNGISHYFDCFECAIHVLAPQCAHCGCRIIGHGHEAGGEMYCCAHCATHQGVTSLKDRAN